MEKQLILLEERGKVVLRAGVTPNRLWRRRRKLRQTRSSCSKTHRSTLTLTTAVRWLKINNLSNQVHCRHNIQKSLLTWECFELELCLLLLQLDVLLRLLLQDDSFPVAFFVFINSPLLATRKLAANMRNQINVIKCQFYWVTFHKMTACVNHRFFFIWFRITRPAPKYEWKSTGSPSHLLILWNISTYCRASNWTETR